MLALILSAAPAIAQYRLIVPFAAGGSTDMIARSLAQTMSLSVGSAIVVENRPGAGGVIGIESIASSSPEGRTFGVITAGSIIAALSSGANMLSQVRGVSVLGVSGLLIAVPASQGVQNVGSLIALGRARRLLVGTPGSGTVSDVCARQFAVAANMQPPQIVPYKGTAPMIQDLAAGQLDMACIPGGAIAANRSVRVLATTLPYPHPLTPTAPTLESFGIKGVIIGDWIMMVAPRAANTGIMGNWISALGRAMSNPDVVTKQQTIGIDIIPSEDVSPEIAETFLRKQIGVLTPVAMALPR